VTPAGGGEDDAAARMRRGRRERDLRLFLQGARAALLLPAWVVGFSLMGVGALAYDIGAPFWMAVLSTPLIWAGPAQFVLFGSLAAGGALVSIGLAVSLTSMRLLPMGITLLALMRREGQGLGLRLLLAHYTVVTTWVEGMRVLPRLPPRDRAPWFLGFANACVAVTTAMTGLGYVLSASLPLYLAAGLLFLTPLFFSLTLMAGARTLADVAALVLGAATAPVLAVAVGPDLDLLAAGLLGGGVAYLLHRRSR
jgi:predicted branched-subunit amino acid permease